MYVTYEEPLAGRTFTKKQIVEYGERVISYGQIHSKENTGTFIKDSFFRFISQDYLKNKKSLVNKGNFIFADTHKLLHNYYPVRYRYIFFIFNFIYPVFCYYWGIFFRKVIIGRNNGFYIIGRNIFF